MSVRSADTRSSPSSLNTLISSDEARSSVELVELLLPTCGMMIDGMVDEMVKMVSTFEVTNSKQK